MAWKGSGVQFPSAPRNPYGLSAFADDWRLTDKAECTIRTHLTQLHKYAKFCDDEDLQTSSMRAAKSFLLNTKKRRYRGR